MSATAPKPARRPRMIAMAILCAVTGAWVFLQLRPVLDDEELQAMHRWADDVPLAPCERPVLQGDPLPGSGSDAFRDFIRQPACTDPECSALDTAVRHESVCGGEGRRRWIHVVLEHVEGLEDPALRARVLLTLLRAIDDERRGGGGNYLRNQQLVALREQLASVILAPELPDDELVAAAERLVETSPEAIATQVATSALLVRRRRSTKMRNLVTAAAMYEVARTAQQCSTYREMYDALDGFRSDPSVGCACLTGARSVKPQLVGSAATYLAGNFIVNATGVEAERVLERSFLVALRARAGGCVESIEDAAERLNARREGDGWSIELDVGEQRHIMQLERSDTGVVVREHLLDSTDGLTQLPLFVCEAE